MPWHDLNRIAVDLCDETSFILQKETVQRFRVVVAEVSVPLGRSVTESDEGQ